MGVGRHAEVLPGVPGLHPRDPQGRVSGQRHPPRPGVDGLSRPEPGQVVAHGALHAAGQDGHRAHGGADVEGGVQDRRRL